MGRGMGADNTARESELAANLYAALIASPVFLREFLRLVSAHEPDADVGVATEE